jgi:mRNA interferase RelE/StbE
VTDPAARYSLVFRPAALRSLRKLDRQVAERVKAATEALLENPRPRGVKMLAGSHGLLRIRVGDYRVLYAVDDERRVVRIADIGHRGGIYR